MAYNTNVSHLTIFMHFKYFGSRPTALHFFSHKTWALRSTWLQQCCHAEQTIGDLSYFVFYWVNFSNLFLQDSKILLQYFCILSFYGGRRALNTWGRGSGSGWKDLIWTRHWAPCSAIFDKILSALNPAHAHQHCLHLHKQHQPKTSSWDGSRSKQTYPA